MAREDPHFRLRIPEDLKAKIERAAEDSARSITAEIVFRLKESFGVERTETDMLDRRIREMQARLDETTQRRAAVERECEYLAHAIREALAARDELQELEQRRKRVEAGLAAQKAGSA